MTDLETGTGEAKGRVSADPMVKTVYLTARQVAERYSISAMTLWRWCHKGNQGFPCPAQFGGRNYWRLADLQAWETGQTAQVWQSHRNLNREVLSFLALRVTSMIRRGEKWITL